MKGAWSLVEKTRVWLMLQFISENKANKNYNDFDEDVIERFRL